MTAKKAPAKPKASPKSAPKPIKIPGADELVSYVGEGCDRASDTFRKHLVQLKLADGAMVSDHTAAELAHIYVQLRTAAERWAEAGKLIEAAVEQLKTETIPKAFEAEGLTSFNLAIGYRVTVSTKFAASIKGGLKEDAFKWLRGNQLGDLITETVNAGTLSAAGKQLLEEGRELPEELFNAAFLPQTSMIKIK